MLGFYNYTVILTYFGMLAGFAGITYTFGGSIGGALVCLMISGICDMFDGKLASTMERTKEEKRFGVQIDSLSDLICFGVLPAMIVYAVGTGSFRGIPSALYLLCALIRLAWFNVDEEKRQDREEGHRKEYLGLPVTSAALIFPVLFGLGKVFHWPMYAVSSPVLMLTAAAFLTPIRVKKPSLSVGHAWTSHGAHELEPEAEQLAEAK